jgi:Restriction endonuclease BglII
MIAGQKPDQVSICVEVDVGVEILPMKELTQHMSSGVCYYESELYNLIREGRGVPAVPLILVGVVP